MLQLRPDTLARAVEQYRYAATSEQEMIEPRYGVLQSLFADRVFRIPHYQRFYSWGNRQREDLFSDIRKLAGQKEDQHHFMATLVCHKTAETKSVGASQYRIYDIVDGQQRMTTLIIL